LGLALAAGLAFCNAAGTREGEVVEVESVGGESEGRRASIAQVAFASFIGTAVECYDYFLYGTAAALVFNKLFFPQFAPLTGTLASFATFAVGFMARPVGGVIFGHFGDRIGRKSMLVITLLIMGGATFLIGLLPTFDAVGVLAVILLVVLRLLQGFAMGGEWGGATLMAVEHAPDESRNFYASWPQLGAPAGFILSTAVFTAFSSLPEDRFLAWGWRVPFLLSIVLVGVGLFIRLRILESPAFRRVKELRAEVRIPLLEVLKRYPIAALLSTGVVLVNLGGYYLVATFTLAYATEQLGVPRNAALFGLLLAGVAEIAGIVLLARAADLVGRRPVALASAAFVTLFAFPYFWLVDRGSVALLWLAMGLWTFSAGALYGITGALISELFEARVRYSGISLGYQMAGVLGGALAPLIATVLVQWAGGAIWPVATYLFAMSFVSLSAVFLASGRFHVGIR
jgi:MFS transporter, MHS family, shikimate and dehydroshikimate transport protein